MKVYGATEVGILVQNPDLLEIEIDHASYMGTSHVVGGGVLTPPLRKSWSWNFHMVRVEGV